MLIIYIKFPLYNIKYYNSAILGEYEVCCDLFSSLRIFSFAFIYHKVKVAKEKMKSFKKEITTYFNSAILS